MNPFAKVTAVVLLLLKPLVCPVQAYTNDVISREISVFNDGGTGATIEAISREISVFNDGVYAFDVMSREVSVFNYGANQVDLTVGTVAMRAGDSNSVPVMLSSLAPVTNVQMALDFPANLLTNWTILPMLAGSLSNSNGARLYLSFTPLDTQSFFKTQQLGSLKFNAEAGQASAFLSLLIANTTAPLADGTDTPIKRFHNGEVEVINQQPLLRASVPTNGQKFLTLYGLPGTNYTIEFTTNLNAPAVWTPAFTLDPVSFILSSGNLTNTNATIFYRARQ